jgi:hypothetical protein
MQDMHPSILTHIASKLHPRDRLRLGATCREFWELCCSAPPPSYLDHDAFASLPEDHEMVCLNQRISNLIKRLRLPELLECDLDMVRLGRPFACSWGQTELSGYFHLLEHGPSTAPLLLRIHCCMYHATIDIDLEEMHIDQMWNDDEQPLEPSLLDAILERVDAHRNELIRAWADYYDTMSRYEQGFWALAFKTMVRMDLDVHTDQRLQIEHNGFCWEGNYGSFTLTYNSEDESHTLGLLQEVFSYAWHVTWDGVTRRHTVAYREDLDEETKRMVIGTMVRAFPPDTYAVRVVHVDLPGNREPGNLPHDEASQRLFPDQESTVPWWTCDHTEHTIIIL